MNPRRPNLLFLGVLCVGVLALFLTAGCGGDKGTNSDNGSLSGRVFKANSSYPVSGVYVNCGGQSATTDVNGSYTIKGIPLGSQTLTAVKDSFEYFSTTVNITGDITKDIYIISSKGDGGDLGKR